MKQFEGFIFDMDGLLVDTELLYYAATQKVADEFGFPYSQAYYLKYLGLSDAELHKHYYKDFAAFPKAAVQAFITAAYAEIFRMFREESIPLKPGAVELLTVLEERGIPKVVASSNTREVVELLLEKTNLARFFQGSVTADEVTYAKPHPEIVEKAVALLGTHPAATVMLEDSINGIRSACGAGVPVVMVPDLLPPTAEALEKSWAVYDSLLEVAKKIF